jgi:hypothetical protein
VQRSNSSVICFLAPACWMVFRISSPRLAVTAGLQRWGSAQNTLLLFEAFVTGASKAQHHHEDAAIAARAFVAGCGDLAALNAIDETDVVSLCGLALVYSGWVEPSFEIVTSPLLVVKP